LLNKIVIVAKAGVSEGLTLRAAVPYDENRRWSLANPALRAAEPALQFLRKAT
jgi:hypothetical protein